MTQWQYKIGERLISDKRDLVIINREIRHNKRNNSIQWYQYKCNKCSWDNGWATGGNLGKGNGCACCCGRELVFGINDVYTLFPDKRYLFANIEDAKKHTKGEKAFVLAKCPICGDTREILLTDLLRYDHFPCYMCSDGMSVPEKFVYAVLKHSGYTIIRELSNKTFPWCDKFYYDFYIKENKTIIEVNGAQHDIDRQGLFFGKDYSEIQNTDIYKVKLALQHPEDVYRYAIINAYDTRKEALIQEITNNDVFKWLELDKKNIDFDECYRYAITSIVKDVCNEYNKRNGNVKVIELAKQFNVSRPTIRRYLKIGSEYGICIYDITEHKKRQVIKTGKKNSKKVEITTPNGKIYVFDSAKEAENKSYDIFGIQLSQDHINACCRGTYKTTKNCICRRIEE